MGTYFILHITIKSTKPSVGAVAVDNGAGVEIHNRLAYRSRMVCMPSYAGEKNRYSQQWVWEMFYAQSNCCVYRH